MAKVAAVVVLYNPDIIFFDNILTYIDQIEKLYVIDNSDSTKNTLFLNKLLNIKKVEYIDNKSNLGVAAALNIGANRALQDGFDFLLTMDQDSNATESMVEKMLLILNKYQDVAIVTANQLNEGFELPEYKEAEEEILFTITSGNLLALSKYRKVGGFLECLFIDYVDHEFCLRLSSFGFKLVRANNAILYHKLGKLEKRTLLDIDFYPSHHSSKRYYYRTRNRFYVSSLYKREFKSYVKSDRKRFFREIIEMIIFETDIFAKIRMIIKGYIDYKKKSFTII